MSLSNHQFVEVTMGNVFYRSAFNDQLNAAYRSARPRRVMRLPTTAKRAT